MPSRGPIVINCGKSEIERCSGNSVLENGENRPLAMHRGSGNKEPQKRHSRLNMGSEPISIANIEVSETTRGLQCLSKANIGQAIYPVRRSKNEECINMRSYYDD